MTQFVDYIGLGQTNEEIALLIEHDAFETLHPFFPRGVSVEDYPFCEECGDTAEGLMHNNTWRNVEPLLESTNE
jgi:hypothetical protein